MEDFNVDTEWLEEIGNDFVEDLDFDSLKDDDDDKTEWRIQRLGMPTCSIFGKLVVRTKDKKGYTLSTGATAENLIYKIAWERLLKSGNVSNGLGRLDINSKEVTHGSDWESSAREKYSAITKNEVISENEFIKLDDWIGGTPDGFVGDDGIIEIKCPYNGGNHLKSLLTGQIYNDDYVYQIQGYLWITDRKWCDFITYDPDLIEELQVNIIRVERDEEIINGIKLVMEQVKTKIKEILNSEKLKIN